MSEGAQGPDGPASTPAPGWAEQVAGAKTWLVPRRPEYDPTPWRRFYLLCAFISRRYFMEDRCGSLAASLTISTLLSTVPTIGVALLVVGLMDPDAGAALLQQLFTSVFPETSRATQMADGVLEMAGNVTISNLGAWGFGVALVIAFVLFQTLERTFNQIWRTTRRRSILVKFTMFYTLATLGPLVILFSLAQPFLPGVSLALGTPLFTSLLAFVLLNRFLPYAKVSWSGALIGGVVSAVLFELGKVGFGLYVTRFALSTYEGLYGSLAILPVFVVWSQLSWMVVLLGAEIAYVHQHRRSIALLGFMNRYVLDRLAMQRPSGRTAARIMLAIADQFVRRKIGHTPDSLAERFELGLDTVGEILIRLRRAELVIEVDEPPQAVIPGRPLEQIRVLDVIGQFDQDQARGARDDRLSRVFADFDGIRERIVGETTFRDLIAEERSPPPADESGPPVVVAGPGS